MRILLAVSGGIDSMYMLNRASELFPGASFAVANCNFSLRGEEADLDSQFVVNWCSEHGLQCFTRKFDTTEYAVRKGISIEMAARELRYAWFSELCSEEGFDAVAVAHNANDNAETLILNLLRGTGTKGIRGMSGSRILRPLLGISREEIRRWMEGHGCSWREDSTNRDTAIARNKVRHVILPWLKANFDPRLTEHLCKSAAILRGELTRPEAVADKPPPPRAPLPQFTLAIEPDQGFQRVATAIGELPATACLSRAALAGRQLELRPWRDGDRIAPTGMNGRSRKLQDVFVTAKVPPDVRAALPLVADAETGEILWVPGYRIA